jgi:hypothetical protein
VAARWLARLHLRFAGEGDTLVRSAPLLRYDAAFLRLWVERAEAFQSARLRPDAWESVVAGYDRAVERLIRLPTTLIHGEFYASNILVQETEEGSRIRPVDWETAAVGPGLIDLAALTSGAWTERERKEMAAAYHGTLLAEGGPGLPFDELLVALDDCRLHLAIRWLGWAPDWSPPPENAHDWLAESISILDNSVIDRLNRGPAGERLARGRAANEHTRIAARRRFLRGDVVGPSQEGTPTPDCSPTGPGGAPTKGQPLQKARRRPGDETSTPSE